MLLIFFFLSVRVLIGKGTLKRRASMAFTGWIL